MSSTWPQSLPSGGHRGPRHPGSLPVDLGAGAEFQRFCEADADFAYHAVLARHRYSVCWQRGVCFQKSRLDILWRDRRIAGRTVEFSRDRDTVVRSPDEGEIITLA